MKPFFPFFINSLLAVVCGFAVTNSAKAQNMNLRINEVLASNNTIQYDDFFEYDDWIEIYNPPGSGITDLAGYYLSDDPDTLDKWQIPADDAGVTTVLPNSFIVFWLDDDYYNATTQGPAHNAYFTLSADGETIFLTAPDATTIIDSVTYPAMATDVSWGRSCDGCPDWQYFNNVTFEDNNFEIQANDLLFINEIQTNNISTYDDLENEFDPWFEIYNPNAHQVNLANYYLSVDGTPLAWQVPGTNPQRTVIPPNSFMLIWCDYDMTDDVNHAPFTLSTSGTITLTGPDGNTAIDSYTYPIVPDDQSYGRQVDGSASSIFFNIPTPTVTNQLVIIQPQNLVINEIMTANQTDIVDNVGEHEDWIEIYNPNAFPVNIGGYYMSDDPEQPTRWVIPSSFADSVTVPAMGWLLFWADNDEAQGVRHTSFRLSNNGEYLGLFSPDGFTIADEIAWGYIAPDTSYGRFTDGAEEWVLFIETTPDASNNGATISINESELRGLHVYPNPTERYLNFSEATNVEVYTVSGTRMEQHFQVRQIDTYSWATGVYLLRTSDGRTTRVMKL